MKLTAQLQALAEGSAKRHPGPAQDIMRGAIEALEATTILDNAFKTGDKLPQIKLPDAIGNTVNLHEILKTDKLVLAFYRGGWCPYCNIELKALQEALPEIEAKGAKLIAISPEVPDNSLSTSEKNGLAFTVLSDTNNKLARAMNLVYKLPEELVNLYKSFKIDLVHSQQNEANELPIAATYVIAQDGTITYHFLAEDYKLRADPEAILKAL